MNALSLLLFSALLVSCHEEWRDCQTKCAAEPDVGPCDAVIPKYYFDQVAGECREFEWGGCEGVVPFNTLEECEECDCFL